MPYNVNKYNGALVATVEDGTVDNTLDIRLIGRNYAGYGEVQNENFVHLLENFAGSSEPPKKITGQVWYDSNNKKLKFYDGTKFRTTGGAEIGTVQPAGLTIGDFWFNTGTNQLYAWSGNNFVLVGPQAVESAGTTELKSMSLTDIGGTSHAVVRAIINNKTVFIIANSEFQIPDNVVEGFKLIKKGITLVDTSKIVTSDPQYGVTTSEYRFWGTSSSSLKLLDSNGASYVPDDFILADNPTFTEIVNFSIGGVRFGGQQGNVRLYIDNNNPTLESGVDNASIVFKTKLAGDTFFKIPMTLQGNDILPGSSITSLGRNSTNQKFASVYAVDFYGNFKGTADRANLLNVDGTYLDGSVAADPNTLSARDSNGNLIANQFVGLATRATNINGGIPNAMPFQSAAGTTTFLNPGNPNEVLAIAADGTLDWKPISSLVNAGNADAVKVNSANLVNSTHYVTFTNGVSGYQDLKIDVNTLTYNPNTNTLTTSFFNGQATSASYADLAEKFLPDRDYEEGTVVAVGGEKEVTACNVGQRAIGVISLKPAYIMNNDLVNGVNIALKGRVPVKIKGSILKGQKLIAGEDGTAVVSPINSCDVFAIALETNDNPEVKLVECLIL